MTCSCKLAFLWRRKNKSPAVPAAIVAPAYIALIILYGRASAFPLLLSVGVLGEAGFDEFADEGGGEWFFGMEADGAFAGVVVLEEVAVGLGDGARHVVEGTLVFWCRRR